ncbi:GNAT family N-acetyltransferase [Flavobacterium sp.]|uniref:GNAT family N-acetyltransferase n=1 Tax=Flavobacterium sp. TaxID=239 RepID=UPI002606EB6A|nr:GNAT family N-acetyltransferase [Flavobacterium sp.]
MLNLIRYQPDLRPIWDAFVRNSCNGTFLFERDFMDYHADRFQDFSVLIFKKNQLIAVFPATVSHNKISSHAGLSYGGLIYDKMSQQTSNDILEALISFYESAGISEISCKLIPEIYNQKPANHWEYSLFQKGVQLYRNDALSAIDYSFPIAFSDLRKRHLKAAAQSDLQISNKTDLITFWNDVLIPVLQQRHGIEPVHTAAEITLLQQRFPENIILYTVSLNQQLLGGTVLFVTKQTVHAQYIAMRKDREIKGAFDRLFAQIILEFKDKKFFSFGISTERDGMYLNSGLIAWKESFGAQTYCQRFYRLTI